MSVVRNRTVRNLGSLACLAVAGALLGLPSPAAADEIFRLKTTVTIPGSSATTPFVSGDISWVDPSLGAYFFADRSLNGIDVINTSTKAITQLDHGGFVGFTGNNNTSGPNGVLTVDHHARGDGDHDGDDHRRTEVWAGDGNSTVKVIDYKTGEVLHTISTGGMNRADELCYDPAEHLIQIANDADTPPFISFIPTEGPKAYTVIKQIKFDGLAGDGPNATNGIEQCQWNPREGRIYLNIPEVNGSGSDTADGNVVVIDPRTLKIVRIIDIPIADCAGPQGMALGPAPQILLGCNAPSIPSGVRNSVVIHEDTGAVISVLAALGGADEVWFNPGDGHYFLGDSAATPNRIIGVVDSLNDHPDQSIIIAPATPATNKGAHSVAADPVRNEAYVPIPNNSGSTICPAPTVGCIAVFGPSGHDDPPVFAGR